MAIKNSKGQGVIEYLIIVALMGVAAISVIKLLQHTTNYKFAQIINALQGSEGSNELSQINKVRSNHYKKKDLSNFMRSAANPKKSDKR